MTRCQSCGTVNLENAQYCDECGSRLSASGLESQPEYRPPVPSNPGFRPSVTSIGITPVVEPAANGSEAASAADQASKKRGHARLLIERGAWANTEFPLTSDESNIGRWDADNGIFPDVDLDAFDPDAKVSRKHARIVRRDGAYMIEDLGSTNGTFINRGRRLLPGVPQPLNEGDEIIVGKTFLRFQIGD
ncbi:MAG: FHA domain-containing protein [Acidobacteria bacterium]|nr:FHA domain-containing protein [Acidobacteriota bacterium]